MLVFKFNQFILNQLCSINKLQIIHYFPIKNKKFYMIILSQKFDFSYIDFQFKFIKLATLK